MRMEKELIDTHKKKKVKAERECMWLAKERRWRKNESVSSHPLLTTPHHSTNKKKNSENNASFSLSLSLSLSPHTAESDTLANDDDKVRLMHSLFVHVLVVLARSLSAYGMATNKWQGRGEERTWRLVGWHGGTIYWTREGIFGCHVHVWLAAQIIVSTCVNKVSLVHVQMIRFTVWETDLARARPSGIIGQREGGETRHRCSCCCCCCMTTARTTDPRQPSSWRADLNNKNKDFHSNAHFDVQVQPQQPQPPFASLDTLVHSLCDTEKHPLDYFPVQNLRNHWMSIFAPHKPIICNFHCKVSFAQRNTRIWRLSGAAQTSMPCVFELTWELHSSSSHTEDYTSQSFCFDVIDGTKNKRNRPAKLL